jgi:hypothetical protein
VLQFMSLLLRATIILSKLVLMGRWNPTWIPRYLTPLPSGIHCRPTSWPQSHSFFFLLAHIATDLFQFTFAPYALQKRSKTLCVLSMLAREPRKYKVVSFAKVWSLMQPPLGSVRPSIPNRRSSSMCPSTSVARMKR